MGKSGMARGNPNPKQENLAPRFSSTNQPKNRGRKKSTLKALTIGEGLTSDDSARIMKWVAGMNMDEMKQVVMDEKQPVIVRVFVKAVLRDFKNGQLDNIEKIMDRAFGKAVARQEVVTKELPKFIGFGEVAVDAEVIGEDE